MAGETDQSQASRPFERGASGPGEGPLTANRWVVLAGIVGALGIALGAFGAHGLSDVRPEADISIWHTAADYHQLHAVVLLAVGLVTPQSPARSRLRWVSLLFLGGIILFSGSLYALVLTQHRWLGAITPFGGLSLIGGWVLLAVQGLLRAGGRDQRR